MTTHEGETAYFFDKQGNPVKDPKDADTIEVVGTDGTHTILKHPEPVKPAPQR